jgi:predicted RNase H-like HicB family nuclease/uncharacterized damage-inducible protein DinB
MTEGTALVRHRVAVEDIEPDHWVAWLLDLPGCFSSAPTREEALARVPACIAGYFGWIAGHDASKPRAAGPHAETLVEEFRSFASDQDPDYLVNAFFRADCRPLRHHDVMAALRLLGWSRDDLTRVVRPLPREWLWQPVPGEARGSIAGVLDHVAGAENWYLDRLDLGLDWPALPDDPLARLEAVRAHTQAQLLKLEGDYRITQRCGERWSARKLVRRALWHERDHTQHIAGLAASLG